MKTYSDIKKNCDNGFALVEILIAVTILSIVLMSVFTGVATSAHALSQAGNRTIAMQIARSEMNMLIQRNMRAPDISDEPVDGHSGFTLTRITERYEHPLFADLPVFKTDIIVTWSVGGYSYKEQKFELNYLHSQ